MDRPTPGDQIEAIDKMLDALDSGEDGECSLCGNPANPRDLFWYPTVDGCPGICRGCRSRLEAMTTGPDQP